MTRIRYCPVVPLESAEMGDGSSGRALPVSHYRAAREVVGPAEGRNGLLRPTTPMVFRPKRVISAGPNGTACSPSWRGRGGSCRWRSPRGASLAGALVRPRRRPAGAGAAGRRRVAPAHDAALAVRQPDLRPGAHGNALRLRLPPGDLRAARPTTLWLFRHADPARRPVLATYCIRATNKIICRTDTISSQDSPGAPGRWGCPPGRRRARGGRGTRRRRGPGGRGSGVRRWARRRAGAPRRGRGAPWRPGGQPGPLTGGRRVGSITRRPRHRRGVRWSGGRSARAGGCCSPRPGRG